MIKVFVAAAIVAISLPALAGERCLTKKGFVAATSEAGYKAAQAAVDANDMQALYGILAKGRAMKLPPNTRAEWLDRHGSAVKLKVDGHGILWTSKRAIMCK